VGARLAIGRVKAWMTDPSVVTTSCGVRYS